MELIKNEGGKVAELAESVDKEKVAKEIESLGQRWDTLLKKAENRSVGLEACNLKPLHVHIEKEATFDVNILSACLRVFKMS